LFFCFVVWFLFWGEKKKKKKKIFGWEMVWRSQANAFHEAE